MTAEQLTDTCSDEKRPRLVKCRVIEQFAPYANIRRLTLAAEEIAISCSPGQFVHVLCNAHSQSYDPLLRRPFSIHFADPQAGTIVILYEIRGRGTQILSTKQEGDQVDIIGPLGRGFQIPESHDGEFWLVGGGIGVAPLYFLLRSLQSKYGRECIRFLVGARTCDSVLCRHEFAAHCSQLFVSTDDGSEGYAGFVTALTEECLSREASLRNPIIYACGPMPMLKEVAAISRRWNLQCQVSLETKMACGLGACMGCAVKLRACEEPGASDDSNFKYALSCVEGPVFSADEIIWE